jgi:3-methylcrotonyl-CoA carboxylase beta subunit
MAARGETWDEKERTNYERRIKRQYEKQGHPYYASSRLWDDGVIDPVDTRRVLGQAISVSLNNLRHDDMPHGIFRM